MNKRDIRQAGYQRGWNIASWQEMPEIGSRLPRDMDWVGIGEIADVSEQIEAWSMLCVEAESYNRDFSPFEFTAHDINSSRDPEGNWAAFDEGITAGFNAYRRKHFPLARLRQWAKEAAAA